MKNRLGITSGEFLDTYTSRVTTRSGLHLVRLNMREADLECPFVTPEGCTIYSDRPWACRLAPIDVNSQGDYHFIFPDSKCMGMKETTEWTVATWMEDQGLLFYEEVEAVFRGLPERIKFTGMPTLDRHIAEMYFMACYDVDRFRKFVFNSSFLKEYAVSPELAERMRHDDVELMKYGFVWLADGVDPAKTIALRDEAFSSPGDES
jgi:hypothetical protein